MSFGLLDTPATAGPYAWSTAAFVLEGFITPLVLPVRAQH
jgi:hypothetical protein